MVHALPEARGDVRARGRGLEWRPKRARVKRSRCGCPAARTCCEHQTDLHFHAAACVEMELADALFSRDCG